MDELAKSCGCPTIFRHSTDYVQLNRQQVSLNESESAGANRVRIFFLSIGFRRL
jgi:hypothetical protein